MNKGDRQYKRTGIAATRKKARKAFEMITSAPGIHKADLARNFYKSGGHGDQLLCLCENHGFLVYEDEEGRVWPYMGMTHDD